MHQGRVGHPVRVGAGELARQPDLGVRVRVRVRVRVGVRVRVKVQVRG